MFEIIESLQLKLISGIFSLFCCIGYMKEVVYGSFIYQIHKQSQLNNTTTLIKHIPYCIINNLRSTDNGFSKANKILMVCSRRKPIAD